MDTFIVMQAIWDTFQIFILALGISIVFSVIATLTMSEEQIEDFIKKYGWF